jgi:hypothetical protein
MNRLLKVAILAICTVPLYAQSQPPNAAELAETVFGIIAGDKTKTQTYCQVLDLSDELDQVDHRKKTKDLSQKINELQTKLGPEYLALLEANKYLDPNSKGGQEIVSNFDKLDSSCGTNSNVAIDLLTLCRRSAMGFNRRRSTPRSWGEGSRKPAHDRGARA